MRRGASRASTLRGSVVAVLAGAVLATLLTACGGGPGAGEAVRTAAPQATPTASPSPPVAVVDVPVQSATIAPAVPAVPPVQLTIGDIGVDMPVTEVGLDQNGAMELPADPAMAGWYRFGPDATSTSGNVVIAAHVDAPGYGIGPLANLRDAAPGQPVSVRAADGSTRSYVLESVTMYDKTVLPTSDLFARDGAPGLVIITCGGPFNYDTGHYRDNVVAIARLP